MNNFYNKFSNDYPTGKAAKNPSMKVPIAPQVPLRKPLLTKFFCFSLKTTVLIVSYAHIILAAMTIPVVAMSFQKGSSAAKDDDEFMIERNIYHGTVIAVLSAIIIIHALLLGGTYKKRTSLITAYLIIFGIIVGLSICGTVKKIVMGMVNPSLLFQHLLIIVFGIFSLMVASAFRTQLLNDRMMALTMQSSALNDPPPYNEA